PADGSAGFFMEVRWIGRCSAFAHRLRHALGSRLLQQLLDLLLGFRRGRALPLAQRLLLLAECFLLLTQGRLSFAQRGLLLAEAGMLRLQGLTLGIELGGFGRDRLARGGRGLIAAGLAVQLGDAAGQARLLRRQRGRARAELALLTAKAALLCTQLALLRAERTLLPAQLALFLAERGHGGIDGLRALDVAAVADHLGLVAVAEPQQRFARLAQLPHGGKVAGGTVDGGRVAVEQGEGA